MLVFVSECYLNWILGRKVYEEVMKRKLIFLLFLIVVFFSLIG